MLNEVVKELGFEDEKEFHKLVASTDTSTQEKYNKFKDWQYNDGSKEGLLNLRRESKGGQNESQICSNK